MTTGIRSSADGSKSYIAVGGTDRVTIDAATGKLTSTYSPPTGERSLALATMQKFEDEFGASLAANGHQKLPSGLIIQWGTLKIGDVSSAVGIPVTLPITFPNQNLFAIVGCQETGSGGWNAFIVSKSSSSVTIAPMEWSSVVQNASANWFAIGY